MFVVVACGDPPAAGTDDTGSSSGSTTAAATTGAMPTTEVMPTTGAAPGSTGEDSSAGSSTTEISHELSGTTTDTGTTGPAGVCGDGQVDPDEGCDDGAANGDMHSCTAQCQWNVCGDGKVGPGEGCDDGNDVDGDACSNTCVPLTCGNGSPDRGEPCDDGNADNTDACTSWCTLPVCGDAYAQANNDEQCDHGANNADDAACTEACQQAYCGDALVWSDGGDEQCDHGSFNNGPGQLCTEDCLLNTCGDGDMSPGEQCDDGANNGPGHWCLADCEVNVCGDGDQGPLEECDDGNGSSFDGCTGTCTLAVCGDGFTQPGEECDAGWNNNSNTGSCTLTCKKAACGDGFLQTVVGELCDDGNLLEGDGCSGNCKQKLEILQVEAGVHHTCVRVTGGRIKCWGRNDHGELGRGDTATIGDGPGEMGSALPYVDLGPMITATDIALGASHTCALLSAGTVKCWGGNSRGQLGSGNTADRGDGPGEMGVNLATVDLGVAKVVDLTAAGEFTCAQTMDGKVKCWGRNGDGELGLGDTNHRGDGPGEMGVNLPFVDIAPGEKLVAVRAGSRHACAWLNSGKLKCWGAGAILGLGDTASRGDGPGEMGVNLPFVDTWKVITMLATGDDGTCVHLAAESNKAVRCWGDNSRGQLGVGDLAARGDAPGEMGAALPITDANGPIASPALRTGKQFACALRYDDAAVCWGRNDVGQLGQGHSEDIGDEPGEMGPVLKRVELGTDKHAVTLKPSMGFGAGASHACLVLNDETLKCWGNNANGELGLGDTEHRGDEPGEMGDALPTVKLITDWF